MLKGATGSSPNPRIEISQLAEKLLADGRRWASAETQVARLELADLKNRVIRAAAWAMLALVSSLCAMIALSQAGIALLATLLGSTGVASLAVSGLLLLVAGIAVIAIRKTLSWQTESIFFRWFTRGSGMETGR